MPWIIDFAPGVERDLDKLDPQVSRKIINYLETRVATKDDPRSIGKALSGTLNEFWRYEVGDWRMIVRILDKKLTILVVEVGHRREVYR